ncbi:MAG: SDR family NAD(P)-dependent oxidoreductase [Actinobacteria bacterium]|nr:SDR family NAD(P)-dependent oxidoreductase [Actinomycetota bacterium]
MDFTDKVVVVTGASSGIGRETALAFARRGARLALSDINEEGLGEIRAETESLSTQTYTQVADVSIAEDVGGFCENVYGELGRVDVLCNNAGVAVGGDLEDIALYDWEWIVGVNLWGVIHGCHFFYPHMIAQGGGGHIVNVASAGGLIPLPGSIPYSTTKYGVVGFSETLRAEAALHGIGVTAMCPGFVLSGIYSSARQCTQRQDMTQDEAVKETEERLGKRGRTPDRVAAAIIDAVEKNKGLVRMFPEAYAPDYLHRMNRRIFDFLLVVAVKLGQKGMQNPRG